MCLETIAIAHVRSIWSPILHAMTLTSSPSSGRDLHSFPLMNFSVSSVILSVSLSGANPTPNEVSLDRRRLVSYSPLRSTLPWPILQSRVTSHSTSRLLQVFSRYEYAALRAQVLYGSLTPLTSVVALPTSKTYMGSNIEPPPK